MANLNGQNVLDLILACKAAETHKVETDEFGACLACGEHGDGPTWVKDCVEGDGQVMRFRGEGDVTCESGKHYYNAGGQRLRDDFMDNPSYRYGDVGDMEGYEMQMGGDW